MFPRGAHYCQTMPLNGRCCLPVGKSALYCPTARKNVPFCRRNLSLPNVHYCRMQSNALCCQRATKILRLSRTRPRNAPFCIQRNRRLRKSLLPVKSKKKQRLKLNGGLIKASEPNTTATTSASPSPAVADVLQQLVTSNTFPTESKNSYAETLNSSSFSANRCPALCNRVFKRRRARRTGKGIRRKWNETMCFTICRMI